MPATLIRSNIVTMDPKYPRAEAMLIDGGRIIAIGESRRVADIAPAGTRHLDFRGETIVPGFIDTHNHMLWTGMQRRIVDLSGCRSIADILDRVRNFARANHQAEWITSGEGWHVASLRERRYPTARELDEVCGERPVYLPRVGHAAVANSAALARAGVDHWTPNPAGGKIEKDPVTGEPTGLLLEQPAFSLVGHLVPKPSREESRQALQDIQKEYHAAGISGVIEPGLTPEMMAVYQDLWAEHCLSVRTLAMPLADASRPETHVIDEFRSWGVRTGFGDEWLRLGGIKAYVDGGASLGTALMREPHPDEKCSCGIQVTSTDRFARLAQFCAESGWSLGVHAVGGQAIDIVLDTFERINANIRIAPLRFTIIHAYLWPTERNIQQARDLGVQVATQPTMQYKFGQLLLERFGPEMMASATPIRAWLDGGVMVGGGSDSPITPFPALLGLWQAVTRHIEGSSFVVGADQSVSPEQALSLYTRNAAHLSFAEHERGMLRPGMLADWVALGADPTTCDAEALATIPVRATAVGGKIVHES